MPQNCGGSMYTHIFIPMKKMIAQKYTNVIAYRVNFIMRFCQISNCAPAYMQSLNITSLKPLYLIFKTILELAEKYGITILTQASFMSTICVITIWDQYLSDSSAIRIYLISDR